MSCGIELCIWITMSRLAYGLDLVVQHFVNSLFLAASQIVDEPIPADCHPEEHADFGGIGLTWGLDYKVKSAAQCVFCSHICITTRLSVFGCVLQMHVPPSDIQDAI